MSVRESEWERRVSGGESESEWGRVRVSECGRVSVGEREGDFGRERG